MSEEMRENLNPLENDTADMSGADNAGKKPAKSEKPQKIKAHRMTKEEKQAARESAKNKSKAQKAWEDSIVANKRVKREEINRKLKKAMLILLIFSLALTSTVYVMLLFIDANNVRITATNTIDKSISMSIDRVNWTPYLDVDGPDNMWHNSYNFNYVNCNSRPPTIEEIETQLKEGAEQGMYMNENGEMITVAGNRSKNDLIAFCFYVRNTSEILVPYNYTMSIETNDKGLENSLRVMWSAHVIGTSADREDRPQTSTNVYAALSTDERLAFNDGVEKIAYPVNSFFNWTEEQFEMYENGKVLNTYSNLWEDIDLTDGMGNYIYRDNDHFRETVGYIDTKPFVTDEEGNITAVIKEQSYLDISEMVCIYVCVWLEGSDFDCNDSVLGGYITLSINFETY